MSQLPILNEFGYLPKGTHTATLSEVQCVFGSSSKVRTEKWSDFLRFVDIIQKTEGFDAIEIGGSFLGRTDEPSDIDAALELRPVERPLSSVLALLTFEMTTKVRSQFGVQYIVKERNCDLYKAQVPSTFAFASNGLILFRVLKREERARIGGILKRPISHDEDFRGIIRIEIPTAPLDSE